MRFASHFEIACSENDAKCASMFFNSLILILYNLFVFNETMRLRN